METKQEAGNVNTGNIAMEDKRIAITMPFYWLRGIIATGIYGLFLFILIEDGFPLRHFSIGNLVVFLVTTAIWLWYVARQKTVTTFDAIDKKAYRRNPLYTMNEVDFADIAEITAVSESGTGGGGTYFKIALKKDRLGKGIRITDSYKETDLEMLRLTNTVLPAVAKMLEEAEGGGETAERKTGFPENPSCYRKVDAHYVFNRAGRAMCVVLVGLAILALGLYKGEWVLWAAGIAIALYSLVIIVAIDMDTAARTITLNRAFGLWKKSLPMKRFVAINITRSHTNGFYTGTTAAMEFAEPEQTADLAWAYFTKKLSVLVDESNAIIFGSLDSGEASGGKGE